MWARVKLGKVEEVLRRPRAITIGVGDKAVQHPANIFAIWSVRELAAISIYPVQRAARKPKRFYNEGTPAYAFDSENDVVIESIVWTKRDDIAESASQRKSEALQLAAEHAESARRAFVSTGEVKQTIYRLKFDEARAIKKGESNASKVPLAAKRSARKSKTLDAVADEWLAKGNAWIAAAASIEDEYDRIVDEINALPDDENVDDALATILDGASWPEP